MLILDRALEDRLVAELRRNRRRGEVALVRASLALARGHARALAGRVGLAGDEAEEIVGEALLLAVRTYDPDGGSRWSTWARWRLRDALRSQSRRFGEAAAGAWWARSEADRVRSAKAPAGTWGTASAANASEKRRAEEDLNGPPDRRSLAVDECVELRRLAERAQRALATLDERTRQIVLAHAEGHTPTQLQGRFALSRNWITHLRGVGMQRIREAVGRL